MTTYRSLNHTKWPCQYHVVFMPKYRKKSSYGGLREQLGEVLRQLALHRESRVEDGHRLVDHVHMRMSIPPKYSVAQVIGYLKGRARSTSPESWGIGPGTSLGSTFGRGRGYVVSTVGRDAQVIREYIQQQEREDRRLDRLPLA